MPAKKPRGWHTVTPRLFAEDVVGIVGFLKTVFDAEGELNAARPSELRIGDSMVMVSDGGGLRGQSSAFLYVYVADADETFRKAVANGASSLEAPTDTPYGDRRATVRDPWGHVWQVATYRPRG
jgi:uncharacterized glyoxalase superfamily protein PhnB